MARGLRILAFVTLLASAAYWIEQNGKAQPPTKRYHFVRGTVVAVVQGAGGAAAVPAREIALPAAKVYLVRTTDLKTPLTANVTDLSGRFGLKTLQDGVFTVCAEAEGFPRQCVSKEFGSISGRNRLERCGCFPRGARTLRPSLAR
jgi:hypothetical protein